MWQDAQEGVWTTGRSSSPARAGVSASRSHGQWPQRAPTPSSVPGTATLSTRSRRKSGTRRRGARLGELSESDPVGPTDLLTIRKLYRLVDVNLELSFNKLGHHSALGMASVAALVALSVLAVTGGVWKVLVVSWVAFAAMGLGAWLGARADKTNPYRLVWGYGLASGAMVTGGRSSRRRRCCCPRPASASPLFRPRS